MLASLMRRLATDEHHRISPSLLWDQDLERFDWQANRVLVVQRVIERGWPNDFCAAFDMYGGEQGLREIIKDIPHLSDKDTQFVCLYFDLRKEDLKCCTTKLSRQARFSS